MNDWKPILLGSYLDTITDYHANGAYEKLKENITLKYEEDYAVMIRTLNFESNDFKSKLIYLNEREYDYLQKSKVQPFDIIMNKIANPGSVYLMPDLKRPVSLAMNLFLIRFNNQIDQQFIYYLMKLNEDYIKRFANGTTTKSITKDAVRGLKFKVPELPIQARISSVLVNLDAKIELNTKINAELEAMAKLIYDYWFVQFDFPDANGKPYKSSGGNMVYNEELKREIPEGWEMKELGEILNTELGGTPSTKIEEYWNGRIPWLNSGEIANFPIIESEETVSESGIANSATALMPKNTCVLSITRHLRPSILGVDACANQSVVGIYESADLKSSYIYPFLVNEIPRLMTLRTGAQQPHINKKTVDESLIINPHKDVLASYYKKTNPVYENIVVLAKENQKLSELRDWLLPMLMNGQVRVGETKEAVKNG